MKEILLTIQFLIVLFALFTPSAHAASNYFVSTVGSDTNPGTSVQPFKSITKALSLASAGDTVHVSSGIYNERVVISKSGIPASPIILRAKDQDTPILDGSGLAYDFAQALLQIGWDGTPVHDITVSGFTIRNSPGRGINIYGDNIIVENSRAYEIWASGVNIRHSNNTIFRNNEVYNTVTCNRNGQLQCGMATWPTAVGVWQSSHTKFVGNTVHHNWGEGMDSWKGTTYTEFIGNTIFDNWSINLYLDHAANTLVEGNFMYETDTAFLTRSDTNWQTLAMGISVSDEAYSDDPGCHATDNAIRNNIIVNTRAGINSYPFQSCNGLKRTLIENNTIVNSWERDLRILTQSHQGTILRNNIISTRPEGVLLEYKSPNDTRFENNLFYFPQGAATSQFIWNGISYASVNNWQTNHTANISKNIFGDPLFVNKNSFLAEGFEITANSPAVNNGIVSSAVKDFRSADRPWGSAFDIGAYEYMEVSSSPSPTPSPSFSISDLKLLISRYLTIGDNSYDLSPQDGKVNMLDADFLIQSLQVMNILKWY